VEYAVEGRNVPAQTQGPSDTWAPAEYAEIDIDAVWAKLKDRHGTEHRVNLLPVLTPHQVLDLVADASWRVSGEN